MKTTLLESQTALSTAGGLLSEGMLDADSSNTVAIVASGLRDRFTPMVVIMTTQRTGRKSKRSCEWFGPGYHVLLPFPTRI